jgi:lipoate-protein ligase A
MTADASRDERSKSREEESVQADSLSRVSRSADCPLSLSQYAVSLMIDPPAAGPWNMAVDEAILESAEPGQCVLRFYQWQAPTLSLGYFQRYEDRWQHEPSRACAVVRRASGGGAILHDHELTYSLTVATDHPLAADRLGLYRAMHLALIDTLTQWSIHPSLCEPSPHTPETKEPFLCFQRRASGDVLLDGAKIAGSAQRRSRSAVLQHGSVLLRCSAAAPELPGIGDLSGRAIQPKELMEAWLQNLGNSTKCPWKVENLSASQHTRAAELVDKKYGTPIWTQNRGRL